MFQLSDITGICMVYVVAKELACEQAFGSLFTGY